MRPFWIRSGLALCDTDDGNRLVCTDALLRAWLERPELVPPEEACDAERRLHARLLAAPREAVTDIDLGRMKDNDARENWRLFLRFRDRLIASPTLEAAYLRLFADARRDGRIDVPPLFVDQLAQIILHHVMADCEDGLLLRVAECLFREQRATVENGRVLLADREFVEERASDPGLGDLGRLLAQGNVRTKGAQVEMLDPAAADIWFGRDERHDLGVEITVPQPGAHALAVVLGAWVRHLCGVAVRVRPVSSIDDARWRWHTGLDAQSSALLDRLFQGETLPPGDHRRLLWLARLDFDDPAADQLEGAQAPRPVWLALGMDEDGVVRMKPQNLPLNLPLARPPAVLPDA